MYLTLRYFEIFISWKQCKVAGILKMAVLYAFLFSSYQPVIKVLNILQKINCMHEVSLIGETQGAGETETSVMMK